MPKKLVSMLAAIALCISCFTALAFADTPHTKDELPEGSIEIVYELEGGTTANYEGLVSLLNEKLDISSDVADWAFEQEGKAALSKKTDFVPINETTKKKIGLLTYTFEPLEFPEVGADSWQVYSLRCHEVDYTIALKVTAPAATINFNGINTIALPFNEDGTIDYASIRELVYETVVSGTVPSNMKESSDFKLEYYAVVSDDKHQWSENFEGGDKADLLGIQKTKPVEIDGTYQIRMSYTGEGYLPCSEEVAITFVDDRKIAAAFKDGNIVVNFNDELNDEGVSALKATIYSMVVSAIDENGISLDDLKLEYEDKGLFGSSWKELDGKIETKLGSEYKMQITWPGNGWYKPLHHEFAVAFDHRVPTNIALNGAASVIYMEDHAALESAALEAIVNEEASSLPADAELDIRYHANIELTDEAKDDIKKSINDALDGLSWLPSSFKSAVSGYIMEALEGSLNASGFDAWVAFSGDNITLSTEELGIRESITEKLSKIPLFQESWIEGIVDAIDGVLAKAPIDLQYAPIGGGDQQVRVSYVSASDPKFETYRPCTAEGILTVLPAPVKLSVNSGTIHVDDSLKGVLTATRNDNGNTVNVEGYALYAGITSNAQALITVDLTDEVKNDPKYATAIGALQVIGIDFDNGVTLKDLYSNTEALDKLKDILGNLGANETFENLIKSALQKALGDKMDLEKIEELLGGAVDGQMGEFLEKLKGSLKNGINSVINNVGDNVVIRLGNPEGQAGAYAVAGYIGDSRYSADSFFDSAAAGYLVIKFHGIDVDVQDLKVSRHDSIEGLITTNPSEGVDVLAIYAGVTSGITTSVCIDAPEWANLSDEVKTVSDLRAIMVDNPERLLDMVDIKSPVYAKILARAAGLSNIAGDVPVYYGTPEGFAGIYVVTALAYGNENGKAWGYGVDAGMLTIGLETASVAINSTEICEGQEANQLIVTSPEDANSYSVYVGKSNSIYPIVYADGIEDEGIKQVSNINELISYLADNGEKFLGKMGVDNKRIAAFLTQLLGRDEILGSLGSKIEVRGGQPTELGTYNVYAIAGGSGLAPAASSGELAIVSHTWDEGIAAYEPKCTEKGEMKFTCERCNDVRAEEIGSLGHNIVVDEGTDPTCIQHGVTEGTHCERCGMVFVSQKQIPASGHAVVIDFAVEPTCSATGLTEGSHCATCGIALIAQEQLSPKGHSWDDGKVSSSPTCSNAGIITFTCDDCDEQMIEAVNANGHNPVETEAVDPTCTADGRGEGEHCETCNVVLKAQDIIPALGHKNLVDAAVAPTCTEDGLTEGTHCVRCGEVTQAQLAIPALGHALIVEPEMPPTCTEPGITQGISCSRCGEVIAQQEQIAALGHKAIVDAEVAPTFAEEGLSEGVHCSVCRETIAGQETVPALAHSAAAHNSVAGSSAIGERIHSSNEAGDADGSNATAIEGHPNPLGTGKVGVSEIYMPTSANWALANLICALVSLIAAVMLIVRTVMGNRKALLAAFATAFAATSILLFFLTSDFSAPMVLTNGLTPIHVVLGILSLGVSALAYVKVPKTAKHA